MSHLAFLLFYCLLWHSDTIIHLADLIIISFITGQCSAFNSSTFPGQLADEWTLTECISFISPAGGALGPLFCFARRTRSPVLFFFVSTN